MIRSLTPFYFFFLFWLGACAQPTDQQSPEGQNMPRELPRGRTVANSAIVPPDPPNPNRSTTEAELRLRVRAGQVFRRCFQVSETDVFIGAIDRSDTYTVFYFMVMKVEETDRNGNVLFKVEFERILSSRSHSEMGYTMSTIDFDLNRTTTKADQDTTTRSMEERLAPVLGSSFYVRLGPQGELLDMKGYEQIKAGIQGEEGKWKFNELYLDEAYIKTLLQMVFLPLPESPVQQGEHWTKERVSRESYPPQHPGMDPKYLPFKLVSGCTVDSIFSDRILLGVSHMFTATNPKISFPMVVQTGQYCLDRATGMPLYGSGGQNQEYSYVWWDQEYVDTQPKSSFIAVCTYNSSEEDPNQIFADSWRNLANPEHHLFPPRGR